MTTVSIAPRGGSELLYSSLIKHIGADWFDLQKRLNLILSYCSPAILDPSRVNVVWQHLWTDQSASFGMRDPNFVDRVSRFVYVSNWQLAQFNDLYKVDPPKSVVIRNAIEPIPFIQKPEGPIKLIYTSMPNRGLDVLLDAFALIREGRDVELDVYSSNIIYGSGYARGDGVYNARVLDRCRQAPQVNYKGYATNKAVRAALQKAHIFAYPSTFHETSCLAAIEAGAAGCQIITTGLGALPETCGPHATYVDLTLPRDELVVAYAKTLANRIDNYHSVPLEVWQAQSAWFNGHYNWRHRIQEWRDFFNTLG
jgi:glycosyltransferase involved in cell wall biosynthesis